MLHIFSINQVKLAARKPKATNNLGQKEQVAKHVAAWLTSEEEMH
jgi:hypothetical protein